MRSYIFTKQELKAIEEYLQTGKRSNVVNKILHFIRHNDRILDHVQIYLTLLGLAKTKLGGEKPKLPPGRPPKMLTRLRGLSPYMNRYYCPRCRKWIAKKDAVIYRGQYAFANDAVFKTYNYPVCPKCLKRVRTTAHHHVKKVKEAK